MEAKVEAVEREVEVELIDRPEEIARIEIDEEELRGLADSIRERGLQQRIRVARRGDRFLIIFGDRRYLACKKLGMTKIKATVVDADESEVILDRFVENVQRVNLSPLEEALQYKGMRDKLGMSVDEIAVRVSKSEGHVWRKIRMLEMDEPMMDAIHKGLIGVTVGEELWQVKDKSHRAYLLEMACAHGVTKDVARMWADDWKKSRMEKASAGEGGGGEGPVSLDHKVYIACGLCNGPEEVRELTTISVCRECLDRLNKILSGGFPEKGGTA